MGLLLQVSYQHVKAVIDYQEGKAFKLAPRLTKSHVAPGTYDKMRVSMAAQVEK